jgi:hypothetical protein
MSGDVWRLCALQLSTLPLDAQQHMTGTASSKTMEHSSMHDDLVNCGCSVSTLDAATAACAAGRQERRWKAQQLAEPVHHDLHNMSSSHYLIPGRVKGCYTAA